MGGECGKAGMGNSHSCCEPLASPDDLNFIKGKPGPIVPDLRVIALHLTAHAQPLLGLNVSRIQFGFEGHGPPESPPGTISVLRI